MNTKGDEKHFHIIHAASPTAKAGAIGVSSFLLASIAGDAV